MYILCDKRTRGVYAVEDELKNKVVQIFVDKDDALRYYGLLEANDSVSYKHLTLPTILLV